mmetsp:Transcript_9522/g.30110  ORF Transcript_9522/g.30110 Transcript_9522/m.30110 type:complete len:203 (+) Transcript_9522:193-801(+)
MLCVLRRTGQSRSASPAPSTTPRSTHSSPAAQRMRADAARLHFLPWRVARRPRSRREPPLCGLSCAYCAPLAVAARQTPSPEWRPWHATGCCTHWDECRAPTALSPAATLRQWRCCASVPPLRSSSSARARAVRKRRIERRRPPSRALCFARAPTACSAAVCRPFTQSSWRRSSRCAPWSCGRRREQVEQRRRRRASCGCGW